MLGDGAKFHELPISLIFGLGLPNHDIFDYFGLQGQTWEYNGHNRGCGLRLWPLVVSIRLACLAFEATVTKYIMIWESKAKYE